MLTQFLLSWSLILELVPDTLRIQKSFGGGAGGRRWTLDEPFCFFKLSKEISF